ncbi:uncharacterized protein LOC105765419 [Gossypium raimondii]|uniref:uncharacterized protein LOC105765419 n=1 Tax=Gossypium raimondii TaxID=29730 RepID=UPI00063AF17E|nr:uncharacterized protein LOC105765419 [Gossypium raimondii]
MSKAYDRVLWDFQTGMMLILGFHIDWVTLIMRCMASISYTLGINGNLSDKIVPSKGLRQGDPLSPCIFFVCAEGFIVLLQKAKEEKDDRLLFGDDSKERAENMQHFNSTYEKALGQMVNYDKSLVFFGSSFKEEDNNVVSDALEVRASSNPDKYLGLPMMVGHRKNRAFSYYVDRLKSRMES